MSAKRQNIDMEGDLVKPLLEEYGGIPTVLERKARQAKFKARGPFPLGLMIGFFMNRFVKEGISFDEIIVDPEELTLTVKIQQNPEYNRMRFSFVSKH